MSKWEFDQRFMSEIVDKGYILLENPHLTKSKKKNIKTDISTFKRFLDKDFEDKTSPCTNPPRDIEKLKNYILRRMQSQYNTIGEETILWTMDLFFEEIFDLKGHGKKTQLSLDEQAELTLENYANNSKRFLSTAKPILSDEIIKQIQCVPHLRTSSYCYYDEITDLPYLIVNPKQAPWVLNHETEHALEEIKKINPNIFYLELGPILFELLFNDTLYKNQGFLNRGDYLERTKDTKESLAKIFHYFDIMLDFKHLNFQVPTDVFLQVFSEISNAESETELINFLREEIATTELTDDMTYMYSYLKAIELRERSIEKKEDCAYLLDPYIRTRKFNFTPTEESFAIYKRFTEEMKGKTKIK